eukprot:GDKI01034253.1.p2 GENE.GDKI01034253.1~~GDKI01034253.1.p2  ORF type:complete len:755 (-),score=305.57 GDKI01034253.1:474-2684(-)
MPVDDVTTACLIVIPPVLGIIFSAFEAYWVSSIPLVGPHGIAAADNKNLTDPIKKYDAEPGENVEQQLATMKQVSGFIAEGATAFLWAEYKYLAVYIVLFAAILAPVVDVATMVAFVVGAITSIACGYIGMKIAVFANVRTAHEAWKDLGPAFMVALRSGSVMGFCLVSLGILNLYILIAIYRMDSVFGINNPVHLYEAIAGYGLGGSSIALFARVGGGIYTKAADVGADLSGKNDFGMDEDDPRNPACIADNVGDNVGDIAGMGADLFGSLAESTCAALVIAAASPAVGGISADFPAMMFPIVLSSVGILVGFATVIAVRVFFPVREFAEVEKALKGVLMVSTLIQTPLVLILAYVFLPAEFALDDEFKNVGWWAAAVSVLMGLWSGLVIGYITEYYTSHSYVPVREISRTQIVSAATGIIYGMALGYMSTVVPVICLGLTILVAHSVAGMYGVALSALGMLGTLAMGLTIDAYGPISDNAGGIAEMAGLGGEVRYRTDALDAAGNTTAAIGKGFAIGSAALVSLALFGAFCVRAKVETVDILDPWVFTGLLFGAMMPYAFSAMTMKSVGIAANDMVKECLSQFPAIMEGRMEPQYTRCIEISTQASLREMIAPGALVILSPLVAGFAFGKNCTAGLLAGALVSGIQLAISASNSGGAWDNAKKYIESGALGPDHSKGSAAHKNAVTGDTVGDPLKDTSGPSLNILVKLSAIISLVFGSVIAQNFSNKKGGPVWL